MKKTYRASKRSWWGPPKPKLTDKKRKWFRKLRQNLGCILPALSNLQAVYLNEQTPTSTIKDESGKGDNTYANFDKTGYAESANICSLDGSNFKLGVLFKATATTTLMTLLQVWDYTGNEMSFNLSTDSGNLQIWYSQNGDDYTNFNVAGVTITDGNIYNVEVEFLNNVFTINVNGNTTTQDVGFNIHDGNAKINVSDVDSAYRTDFLIYSCYVDNNNIDFKDDFGTTTIKNNGLAGDLTLIGVSTSVFWNKETNNAKLIQSNCGKFDGSAYGIGNGDNILDSSTNFSGAVKFKTGDDTTTRVITAKRDGSTFCFMLYLETDNRLAIYMSDDGTTGTGHLERFIFDTVSRNEWHEFTFSFDNGHWVYSIDGIDYTGDNTTVTSMYTDTSTRTAIGNYDGGSYNYIGNISYAKFGNAEFNIAEGGLSDTLYNTGTAGGNATLNGATLTDFWSEKQDIYHYNFLNGFDLWENGNAGEEIRVPIGKTVTTSGYTYTATYQAGKWHNNAETKIQLSSTLKAVVDGDCPNPLSYSDFESDFNNAHTAFSNTEEKKHKYLVFYDRVLITSEILKVQKCLKQGNGDDILRDENGSALTDENGIYLTT